MVSVKKSFQLVGGHPALDLVNTLDWRFRETGPEEFLASYDDLLRFSEQSGILTPDQTRELRSSAGRRAGARALQRCIELREAIAEILYARFDERSPTGASLKVLARSIQAARLQQRLRWKKGRLEWRWGESDPELPVWMLAESASDLLLSETVSSARVCDNPECRWLFLDTSKNHTRRWCDMKVCGNRMKARRFKARVTTGSSAPGAGRTS
jgi:predicted RNA-binding Zn ribbon-like protein